MPDFTLILLAGLLVVMIFFTWRSSRKRKAEAEEMQTKLQPGAEIMTQHGIFGTLISLDDEKNEAIIETTPGTKLRVHRQTIVRVVDPVELEEADADLDAADESADTVETTDAAESPADAAEPEFGERVEKPKRAPRKKSTETE
jgi:preprotein translocase subunit YajC